MLNICLFLCPAPKRTQEKRGHRPQKDGMLKAAPLVIALNWKEPKCPLTEETKELWYTKNKLLMGGVTKTNFRNPSVEPKKTQKTTNYMIPFIRSSRIGKVSAW